MVGFYNIVIKASLFDVMNDMTDRQKRGIKVLKPNNSQFTDYRREIIQILTGYLSEMIFIDKRWMCEGSYGGSSSTLGIP